MDVSARAVSIRLNGERRSIPARCSVDQLLGLLGLGERRLAVAVNRDVVPRSAFASRVLRTDDHVEILEAVGGG